MKILKIFAASLLMVSMAYAMPMNSSARSVVPADLLQLISVDYRALKDSNTAMQLKQQLLPDDLKRFEGALKGDTLQGSYSSHHETGGYTQHGEWRVVRKKA